MGVAITYTQQHIPNFKKKKENRNEKEEEEKKQQPNISIEENLNCEYDKKCHVYRTIEAKKLANI